MNEKMMQKRQIFDICFKIPEMLNGMKVKDSTEVLPNFEKIYTFFDVFSHFESKKDVAPGL